MSALGAGDLVLVRPGARIPADGVVREGKRDVNESIITGESVPVEKIEGTRVIAGIVNGAGSPRGSHRHRRTHRTREHHASG